LLRRIDSDFFQLEKWNKNSESWTVRPTNSAQSCPRTAWGWIEHLYFEIIRLQPGQGK
jgi:hypothetical protein